MRKMKKAAVAVSAFTWVLALCLPIGHAAAQVDGSPDDDLGPLPYGRLQTPTEAELQDALLIGAKAGWTLTQTQSMMDLQEDAGPIFSELRQVFPDEFAQADMAHDPGEPVTANFTAAVPEGVAEIAEPLGEQIVLAGGAQLSERAAQQLAETTTDAMRGLGFRELTVSADPIPGEIDVLARRAIGAPQTEAEVLSQLPETVRDRVQLRLTSEAIGGPQHTYGGRGQAARNEVSTARRASR